VTEDIEYTKGQFQVKGVPNKAVPFGAVALTAYVPHNYPEGLEPGLEETSFYDPSNFCFPFGAHACVVEVEAETGQVKVVRYIAVDDVGNVIKPMIVDGMVHGGVAQGVGQALWEGAVYEGDSGQLVTGTMMDYCVPRADQLPNYETDRTETPTPVNPLGIKGAGETGTIAATPAVVNAVVDALSGLGVDHIETMPLTAERVWQTMQTAKSRK
jgi:carbon-monoxide dehydrogenase large subunit